MKINSDFYKSLLDGLYEGVYFVDRDRVIRYWNRAAEQITGFSMEEVVGHSCSDNILIHVDEHGRNLCDSDLCPALKAILEGHEHEGEVFLHHKEGHRLPVLTKISPIRAPNGDITGAVEVFTENVQMLAARERIEELKKLALIDPLTQIGNRRNAEIHLEISFGQMHRYGWPFGILFLDVDHFKQVNDRYGHETGDRVLQTIAKTLCSNLRSSDVPSRWGGEEFVIVTPNVELSVLGQIGRKMLSLVQNSTVETSSGFLQVTVSIGGTVARPEDTQDTLVSRSDNLMYQSKKRGRNRLSLN